MKKTTLRLFTSTALGVSLVAASSVALAQQQPAPPPPPAGGAPAPMAEPAPAPPAPPAEVAPTPIVETPPAPAPEPKKSDASPIGVSYDKGIKFESEDGNFEAKLSLRTQFRFQLDKGTQDGAEYKEAFSIPRGRLQLEGFVFGKDTVYKLEFSLADKLGFGFTKDLWIEQRFSEGKLGLRLGQMKGPFNRQELVSDFASEFNERAITAKWVGGGRDLGILLNNGYADKAPDGVEWSVGLFNSFVAGTDEVRIENCTADPTSGKGACPLPAGGVRGGDWEPAIYARVGYATPKFKGYSEADLEGGPARWGVGLSYKVGLAQFKKGAHDSVIDNMPEGLGFDAALKVEGLDVSLGAFLMAFVDKQTGFGFHAQAGYFVMPKKAQIAVRFAQIPDSADADKNDIEARGAFNWYFHGHQWKWATDFGMTKAGAGAVTDAQLQLRTMAQLTF
jgi:phosphate-selective porin OprO/OprP